LPIILKKYVNWYNTKRTHSSIGYLTAQEMGRNYENWLGGNVSNLLCSPKILLWL